MLCCQNKSKKERLKIDWLRRMMYGRYGVDQMAWVLCGSYFICRLLYLLTRWVFWSYLELALMIFCFYRIFSRNIPKRQAENEKMLLVWRRIAPSLQGFSGVGSALHNQMYTWTRRVKDLPTHRTFACPTCGQKLRVPRGRGKIAISCPKCGADFVRKT